MQPAHPSQVPEATVPALVIASHPPPATREDRPGLKPWDQAASSRGPPRFAGMVLGHRTVKAGHAVFRQGDAFRYLYAVRSGSFKSTVTDRHGRDQVDDFRLAGDLMGLDAIAGEVHASTATALEDSQVLALPALGSRNPADCQEQWQELLYRSMGGEIVRDHDRLLLLGGAGTRVRVAAFLLDLSERLGERGFSRAEFHLRMSRADIGSYLGLALETVSRTLSAFQQEGVLEVQNRHVRILRREALQGMREEGAA